MAIQLKEEGFILRFADTHPRLQEKPLRYNKTNTTHFQEASGVQFKH